MHYTGVRDKKRQKGKKKSEEISALWFSLTQDTSTVYRCIQNLKTLALLGAEKSVMKKFIGEKEKNDNKGNDKHEDADSLLQDTRSRTHEISKS